MSNSIASNPKEYFFKLILQDSAGSSDGNTNIYLGQEGKDFEFSDLSAEVRTYTLEEFQCATLATKRAKHLYLETCYNQNYSILFS